MAQREEREMVVPVVTGNVGDEVIIDRFQQRTLQVWGTWSGTLQVRGAVSKEGDLADVGGPITANGFVSLDSNLQRIAIKTTLFTSGVPCVSFAGTDPA